MAQHIPPARGSGRGSDRDVEPSADNNMSSGDRGLVSGGPLAAYEGAVARDDARAPFAWQHGSRLLLLEPGPLGWVLAELRFDGDACRYVEVQRARYRWAREATGALLSRVFAAGDPAVDRTAHDLQAWLIAR